MKGRRSRLLTVALPVSVVVALGSVALAGGVQSGPSEEGAPQSVGQDRLRNTDVSIKYSRDGTPQGRSQSIQAPGTCITVEVGEGTKPRGVGRIGPSVVCGPDPNDGRLSFAIDTLLTDPSTGEFMEEPIYFISGYTTSEASRVVLEDGDGRGARLELAAPEAGAAEARVFWGSVPSSFSSQKPISIEAKRAGGDTVAEDQLTIGDDPPPGVPPVAPPVR